LRLYLRAKGTVVPRIVLFSILVIVLAACSPDYNWRQVTLADGAVVAMFPGTPETYDRTLDFAGHKIKFTLSAVKIGGVVFAVGYGALPEALRADASARQDMGRQVVRSFYRDAGAAEPATLPAWGTPFRVNGVLPKGPITLEARVWIPSGALIEAIVTSDANAFPGEHAREFLDSVAVPQ
jgi:hypothetical protein